MITIKRTTSDDKDFLTLVKLLDADLEGRYGELQKNFTPLNQLNASMNIVLAYDGPTAVACGALRAMEEAGTVEVKRMFVLQGWRGKGISKKILNELEKWAAEQGFATLRLETAKNQPEAIGLYESSGYERSEAYGPYKNIEISICMKKSLLKK
jgi:putative acetyltransferase